MSQILDMIRGWDGECVVAHRDRAAGATIFIALHDRTLGPAVGGTRMRVYPTAADGLRDAMRLAEGMTHKWAAAGLDVGGGKAVIALSGPIDEGERRRLLTLHGRIVDSMGGVFRTGQDLGTTTEDMALIGRQTRWVHGVYGLEGRGGEQRVVDPGPYTARGVHAAIRAALRHLDGAPGPAGRTILIQGVGDVGDPLARRLGRAGASLLLSDVDRDRAEALAAGLGAGTVPPGAVYDTPCDVFAPCAIGGVLDADTVPRLRCRAVAGSANNQLDTPEDAEALHRLDILYAPDYIANSGGAIAFYMLAQDAPEEEIGRRIDAVEGTLLDVFEQAERRGTSPLAAARRVVEEKLERRR